MSLGISLLAAVSGCKTDDDGTQLLMTSLVPARSAQSGLHSKQVGFYWYLNCKIMVGIFHSKIKLCLPAPPHTVHTTFSSNVCSCLEQCLVRCPAASWRSCDFPGAQRTFCGHQFHSVAGLYNRVQIKEQSTLNGVIYFRCVSRGGGEGKKNNYCGFLNKNSYFCLLLYKKIRERKKKKRL